MRAVRVLLSMAWVSVASAQGSAGEIEHYRWLRPVWTAESARVRGAGDGGVSCAVLPPEVFARALPGLKDLRVMTAEGREVPYALLESGTAVEPSVSVGAERVRAVGRGVVFELRMPRRAYSEVDLLLSTTSDFAAVAMVRAGGRELGEFAVFDLRGQGLVRRTALPLAETDAPMLEVTLRPVGAGAIPAGAVHGAEVPPSREAQRLFTTAVRTEEVEQRGTETVARLRLPRRVPVERVRVELGGGAVPDFRREVEVESRVPGAGGADGEIEEAVTGSIDAVRMRRGGMLLEDERLTVPATLGTNLQEPAEVTVRIRNEGAAALPVRAVELQSRERRVCFPTVRGGLWLAYGDARPPAVAYDVPAIVEGAGTAGVEARIGPEQVNPSFVPREDTRLLSERHPRMVSLLLAVLICGMGVLTFRSLGRLRF